MSEELVSLIARLRVNAEEYRLPSGALLEAAADELERLAHQLGTADAALELRMELWGEQVDEVGRLRAALTDVVEVVSTGGNGEGWNLADAIATARTALTHADNPPAGVYGAPVTDGGPE